MTISAACARAFPITTRNPRGKRNSASWNAVWPTLRARVDVLLAFFRVATALLHGRTRGSRLRSPGHGGPRCAGRWVSPRTSRDFSLRLVRSPASFSLLVLQGPRQRREAVVSFARHGARGPTRQPPARGMLKARSFLHLEKAIQRAEGESPRAFRALDRTGDLVPCHSWSSSAWCTASMRLPTM